MAIKKVMGTETEYGIMVKNDDQFDPISASMLLVNSYQSLTSAGIIWDYDLESPLADARGFEIEEEVSPPSYKENMAINKILMNGARYYVDHAHPEFSTPECTNARQLVAYEKAGERILDLSRINANQFLGPDHRIIIYKNNSDRKGNSYGCHENYLMDRQTPFKRICEQLIPFMITRQIYTGAGKVGSENGTDEADFQISQRADFIEAEVGLDTMAKRPIINTRDEPHADKKKYRRLHIIGGDSNMSEFTIFLKLGVTTIILEMIEDNFIKRDFSLLNPIRALRDISRDIKCKARVQLDNGKKYTALELQTEYYYLARRYLENVAFDPVSASVVTKWGYLIDRLRHDPLSLEREVEWVIKYNLISGYLVRKKAGWDDPRAAMMDLQYHDIRKDKGLYYILEREGKVERILTDDEIAYAMDNAPVDTRAYFRGEAIKRYKSQVYGVNWDSISFSIDDWPIKRVIMAEPTKGSKAYVGELLERSPTAAELIANLTG